MEEITNLSYVKVKPFNFHFESCTTQNIGLSNMLVVFDMSSKTKTKNKTKLMFPYYWFHTDQPYTVVVYYNSTPTISVNRIGIIY